IILLPDYLKTPEHVSAKIWGTLEKRDGSWIIEGHPYMISMAKRLFPGSKGNGRGSACFPASKRITGDLNWFMHRFPVTVKDKKSWKADLDDARKHFIVQEEFLAKPKKVMPPPEFNGELKEFQKEGLAFLLHNPRSLLADEMGLGKTVEALAWLTSLGCSPPYVAVLPPHLLRQWKSEIKKFLGEETTVHTITGLKPYSLPYADIYLIHYLLLRGWKNYLPEFGFKACIFDEIQELRRTQSEKYSAASLLAESVDNVIGLSGTPVFNLGFEIYNILDILNHHCLADFSSFSREWCTGYGSKMVRDPKILGEYLRSEGLFLRRVKEDVLDELPPKRRVIQNIDVDEGKFDELIAPVIDQAKRIADIKDAFERGR
ncbi:ATP-dependent helicase, partial [bacterium]|nr:ATP-dependent helicase [bacterium]